MVAELERETEVLAAPMREFSRKEMHFQSSMAARMRQPDGKATRADDQPSR